MSMDTVKGRLTRLEGGRGCRRTVDDYSDEELIEIAGLSDVWPGLTETERDRRLAELAGLPATAQRIGRDRLAGMGREAVAAIEQEAGRPLSVLTAEEILRAAAYREYDRCVLEAVAATVPAGGRRG